MADAITLLGGETLPIIAYDNVLDDATLTSAATTDDDGAVTNVTGWKTYTWWKPTGGGTYTIEADLGGVFEIGCFAIYGHDAIGTVAMDTWDGSAWVEFGSVLADGSGDVVFVRETALVTTKLRFRFASLTYLAILFAGPALIPPRGVNTGWSDPRLAQVAQVEPEISRDGKWLGTTVQHYRARQSLQIEDLDPSWVVSYWRDFQNQCSAQPFFLHWQRTDYPNSACLCTNADFGASEFSRHRMISVSVSADMQVGGTP